MKTEPDWIEHDGSATCPVPAGHDVEVLHENGTTHRHCYPEKRCWEKPYTVLTYYRDWTAFAQQQAGEVPEWERVRRDAQAKLDEAFAAMEAAITRVQDTIAAHEQPPVDPLREAVRAAWPLVSDARCGELTEKLRARGVTIREGEA